MKETTLAAIKSSHSTYGGCSKGPSKQATVGDTHQPFAGRYFQRLPHGPYGGGIEFMRFGVYPRPKSFNHKKNSLLELDAVGKGQVNTPLADARIQPHGLGMVGFRDLGLAVRVCELRGLGLGSPSLCWCQSSDERAGAKGLGR